MATALDGGPDVIGPLLGLAIGLGAFAASGVGRLLLAGACAGTPRRTVLAEYFVGVLAYTSLFGVLAHLRLPFNLAAAVLLSFLTLGLWARLRRELRPALGCAAVVTVSVALVVSLTPVNPNALDPTTYAYMASTVFQDSWLSQNLAGVPDGDWLRGTADEGVITRAPSLALLWPAAALGWGTSARLVAGMAAWLVLPTFAALADVLDGYLALPLRLLVAAGAIGVYNEVAVLADAQVNQTFALAVVVGAVWACRWLDSSRARALLLLLTGAAVSAGYPEFLAALPLYLACAALLAGRSLRALSVDGVCLVAGWGVVQLTSGLRNARFLFEEAAANPDWWPLPSDPSNPGEVWLDVLFQRPPPLVLAIVLVPVAWYAWHATHCAIGQPCPPARPVVWLSLVVLLGLSVAWTWLALHGPNPNYATFKLGGWVGPGLFLLAVPLLALVPPVARHAVATVLVVLAAARVLGLGIDTPPKVLLYATTEAPAAASSLTMSPAPCELAIASPDPRDQMAALATTAAAVRGCRVQYLSSPNR